MFSPSIADAGLPAVFVLFVVVALVIRQFARSALRPRTDQSNNLGARAPTTAAKAGERQPGEWAPVQFDYPHVDPFIEDISNVKPIPYRPFRWGEYHVTMGIRSMPWDEWIEIDQQFFDYHKVVEHRIRMRGDSTIKVHPAQPGIVGSGQAAAEELVHELAEYLSRRYPSIYQVTRKPLSEKCFPGWYGEGAVKTIGILPLRVTYDLDEQDSMTVASLLVQEDFALMLEGSDGRYYLQAGAICIPGFWRLKDKIGMPLDEIHMTGNVPQYQSKLHLSMGRFFRRLPVDKPVVRNNYGFQVVKPPAAPGADPEAAADPTELAWSRTMHGDEDKADFERSAYIRGTGAPTNELRDAHRGGRVAPLDPATAYLRTERQTLRRLPRTGAIAFTIRVYQTPVVQLAREPGVPGRLASAVRGWSEDVAEYKDLFAYKDVLQYLDQSHNEQVEKGIAVENDRSAAYPF
ncbi:hypothetical protein WOLCODRAFT_137476 [Wolfiporia cocos MD-104 SS10]|uniref:HRQ family protein n=1 Tax=Wolfiporia cocos (strain MD-104) TaxID=742152 RepID=A0A2H3JI66_WOLCO|nr:hypothetical protein WOLCODRAFT_137476 [Wolfiporia cocos MD-104 SS10]